MPPSLSSFIFLILLLLFASIFIDTANASSMNGGAVSKPVRLTTSCGSVVTEVLREEQTLPSAVDTVNGSLNASFNSSLDDFLDCPDDVNCMADSVPAIAGRDAAVSSPMVDYVPGLDRQIFSIFTDSQFESPQETFDQAYHRLVHQGSLLIDQEDAISDEMMDDSVDRTIDSMELVTQALGRPSWVTSASVPTEELMGPVDQCFDHAQEHDHPFSEPVIPDAPVVANVDVDSRFSSYTPCQGHTEPRESCRARFLSAEEYNALFRMIRRVDMQGICRILGPNINTININVPDKNGRGLLHWSTHHFGLMYILIEWFRASPDVVDGLGRSPLARMLKYVGNYEGLDYGKQAAWLLDKMANPREDIDPQGQTLMHYYVRCFPKEDMKLAVALIEAGVRYDHTDAQGETPIDIAARRGWYRTVKMFLRFGAFPNALLNGSDPRVYAPEARIYMLIQHARKLQRQILYEFWALDQLTLHIFELKDPLKANTRKDLYYGLRIDGAIRQLEGYFFSRGILPEKTTEDLLGRPSASSLPTSSGRTEFRERITAVSGAPLQQVSQSRDPDTMVSVLPFCQPANPNPSPELETAIQSTTL